MYQIGQWTRIDRCPECLHAHQARLKKVQPGFDGGLGWPYLLLNKAQFASLPGAR